MQYVRFITLNQRKVGKWMLCTPDERDAYEEAFQTVGIAYRMEIREIRNADTPGKSNSGIGAGHQ